MAKPRDVTAQAEQDGPSLHGSIGGAKGLFVVEFGRRPGRRVARDERSNVADRRAMTRHVLFDS